MDHNRNKNSSKTRLFIEKTYGYILAILIGFMAADLLILYLRPYMLPQKASPPPSSMEQKKIPPSISSYHLIQERNIFNPEGVIPTPLIDKNKQVQTEGSKMNQQAVKTSLPIELKGTIVHRNPRKSVATIVSKGRSSALITSFKVKEKAYKMLEVISIQRRKVIFKNLNNGRKEYVEIPEQMKLSIGYKDAKSKAKKNNDEVLQFGQNEFSIKKSDLSKHTQNISNILKQARMIPNKKGIDGKINGFRFVSIQPNSIYEKLGFKVGDIIKGVNGQPVNNPTKAMELYQALKESDQVQITIERNGREQENTYSITE